MINCPFCGLALRWEKGSTNVQSQDLEDRAPHRVAIRVRASCDQGAVSCGLAFEWDQEVVVRRVGKVTASAVHELGHLPRLREKWMELRDQRAILRSRIDELEQQETQGSIPIDPEKGISRARAEAQAEFVRLQSSIHDLGQELRQIEARMNPVGTGNA